MSSRTELHDAARAPDATRGWPVAIIHAGAPRTGSTYIQDRLRNWSDSGFLQRVTYPDGGSDGLVRAIPVGNAFLLANSMRRDLATDWDIADSEGLLLSLMRAAEPERHLVLSSEDFLFARVEAMTWLRRTLRSHGYSVREAVFVREFKDWAASLLSLSAMDGTILDDDGCLVDFFSVQPVQALVDLVTFLVDVAPSASVLRYGDGDPAIRLLEGFEAISLPSEETAQVPVNRSMTHEEFTVAQALRRRLVREFDRRAICERLVQRSGHVGPPIAWPPFAAADLDELERLGRQLGEAGLGHVVDLLSLDAFLLEQRSGQNNRDAGFAHLRLSPGRPIGAATLDALVDVLLDFRPQDLPGGLEDPREYLRVRPKDAEPCESS